MSEPNPYEPPQESEPLTPVKAFKRNIGVVAILALTPVAIFMTFFVSCAVAWTATNSQIDEPEPPLFWAITLIPTTLVAAGMLIWAIRTILRCR
jgi:hypothetical protein